MSTDVTLTGQVQEALRPHGANYHARNVGGETATTLRFTSCDGCDWLGGWHDEEGYLAHLADIATQAMSDWLGEQRDAIHNAIRRGAYDTRRMDQSRNKARADAVLAALRSRIKPSAPISDADRWDELKHSRGE